MKRLNKKAKVILAVVSSVLVLTCAIGVTLALLNTRSQEVNNKFAGSGVNIGVVENGEGGLAYENGSKGGSGTASNVIPYEEIDKNQADGVIKKKIEILNIYNADYPTGDTYIRVRLVPVIRYDDDAESHPGEVVPMNIPEGAITFEGNSEDEAAWIKVGQGYEATYYYKLSVKRGEYTKPLMENVRYNGTLLGDMPDDAHLEIQVLAEGISAVQTISDETPWPWEDIGVNEGMKRLEELKSAS